MTKRILSMLLCIVMCLSMLPTWALAENDIIEELPVDLAEANAVSVGDDETFLLADGFTAGELEADTFGDETADGETVPAEMLQDPLAEIPEDAGDFAAEAVMEVPVDAEQPAAGEEPENPMAEEPETTDPAPELPGMEGEPAADAVSPAPAEEYLPVVAEPEQPATPGQPEEQNHPDAEIPAETGPVEEQAAEGNDPTESPYEEVPIEEVVIEGIPEEPVTEILPEEKPAVQDIPTETLVTEEQTAKTEEKAATQEIDIRPLDTEVYSGTAELPADNDTLMKGYITEALYGDVAPDGMGPGLAKKNFGGELTGNNARVYKALKSLITKVANGDRSSTEFRIKGNTIAGKKTLSAKAYNDNGLSFNISKVVGAIMADNPYEQYWSTGVYTYGFQGSESRNGDTVDVTGVEFVISFDVAAGYAPSGQSGGYVVDSAKVKTVKKAVSKAKSIVSKAAGLEDIEKLRYYGNQICALTDYNYDALSTNPYVNNNPWELIWVFDGNSKTNVVCEGYSKSFQYLCDLTSFDRNIACYCLEGPYKDLSFGGGGAHMWNAVTLDNGANYLVDITHSDGGDSMNEQVFLLMADSGNPTDGYKITRKDGTKAFYGYDEQCYARSTEAARKITLNKVYLPSPILKKATNVKNGVKVTWQAVSGAEKYRVMRKTSSGSWKKLKDTTSTSYTDKSAKAGVKYRYSVQAISGSTTSGYDKTGKLITRLYTAPELFAAESVKSGIKVSWNKGTGAARYQVFRKGPGDKSWKKVRTTKNTSWTDKDVVSGNKYTYTVRSLNSSGKVISARDTMGVSAICGQGKKLDTPVLTGISNVKTGVQIKWNKVPDAAKYRVLRRTGNGSWKKLADTRSVKLIDKTAKSGTKYSYTVRCVTSDGKKATSAYDSTGKTITFLSAPELSGVSNVTGGVQVEWTKVTGAAKYRVLRKTGSGSWEKIADTTETAYLDSSAIKNMSYTYMVRCISSNGKKYTSAINSSLSITSTTGRTLATPELSKLELVSGGVTLTWQAVTDAAKYRVLRKEYDGSWSKLADLTELSYTDKTVSSGTTYSYTVRCVTADGKATTSDYDSIGKAIYYVAEPVISSFAGEAGNVIINWNPVAGAAQYRVYYRAGKNEDWILLGDTTSTRMIHEYGYNGYFYTVQCLDSSGNPSSLYSIGKQFAVDPYVTINKLTDYKNGYSTDYVDYKQAIAVDYVVSSSDNVDNVIRRLEREENGVWIPMTCGSCWGREGNLENFVVDVSSARYEDDSFREVPVGGNYRIVIALEQNGKTVSLATASTTW